MSCEEDEERRQDRVRQEGTASRRRAWAPRTDDPSRGRSPTRRSWERPRDTGARRSPPPRWSSRRTRTTAEPSAERCSGRDRRARCQGLAAGARRTGSCRACPARSCSDPGSRRWPRRMAVVPRPASIGILVHHVHLGREKASWFCRLMSGFVRARRSSPGRDPRARSPRCRGTSAARGRRESVPAAEHQHALRAAARAPGQGERAPRGSGTHPPTRTAGCR